MKIRFTRLIPKSQEFRKIKELYARAFPLEERAPFLMLVLKARKRGIDFWSVSYDDIWAGMMYVVNYKDLSYLFYLAITEEHRGKGVGSAVLRTARKYYSGRRLFLAIEEVTEDSPNYADRLKRREFYIRNGFSQLGRRLREGKVMYELLGIGGMVSKNDYKQLIECFAGSILTKLFTMEIVD